MCLELFRTWVGDGLLNLSADKLITHMHEVMRFNFHSFVSRGDVNFNSKSDATI